MKGFLGFFLAFGMLVTLCDAACFIEPANPSIKGCVQDGIRYPYGATWVKDCNSCTCYQDGAQCCTTYGRPTGFDEKKCHLVFHTESCSYSVVEKDNPSKTCEFTGMVG
ncbi:beta-microseminoprotein-like [Pelodiscus sinensis]|uniref:beta-microseminoprotein-like n=1 Tax=Pelodiscus sinensis TaxID=13735 RepID=UPI0003C43E23|nr:beta-microseminoprotein-like isoform X3 [Pelodiscus sinensis]|eukprot:XP_006118215.1 beta-microseminoprotein-like isoform X3 [Pelodiscus sinensis]